MISYFLMFSLSFPVLALDCTGGRLIKVPPIVMGRHAIGHGMKIYDYCQIISVLTFRRVDSSSSSPTYINVTVRKDSHMQMAYINSGNYTTLGTYSIPLDQELATHKSIPLDGWAKVVLTLAVGKSGYAIGKKFVDSLPGPTDPTKILGTHPSYPGVGSNPVDEINIHANVFYDICVEGNLGAVVATHSQTLSCPYTDSYTDAGNFSDPISEINGGRPF